MADYRKMYICMFNAATDAVSALERGDIPKAEYILKRAQMDSEDIFESTDNAVIEIQK